jgi:coenzyme PQQ precursor peptide PqqA
MLPLGTARTRRGDSWRSDPPPTNSPAHMRGIRGLHASGERVALHTVAAALRTLDGYTTLPCINSVPVWAARQRGGDTMAWTTPTLVEICIGLEINGYLPAEF